MSSIRGLTRRGPKRVWEGYKNLRVPLEIFNEVRGFMEKRKLEYRAKEEGLSISDLPKTNTEKDLQQMARQLIEEILSEKGMSANTVAVTPQPISTPINYAIRRNKTSKEMVEEYLKQNPNIVFSNTDLSRELQIPGPTLREATRTLAEEDERFNLITGRPNKIQFRS